MDAKTAIKRLMQEHEQYQDIGFGQQDTWYREIATLIEELSARVKTFKQANEYHCKCASTGAVQGVALYELANKYEKALYRIRDASFLDLDVTNGRDALLAMRLVAQEALGYKLPEPQKEG